MKKYLGIWMLAAFMAASCQEPEEPAVVEAAAPELVSTNPADGSGGFTETVLSVAFTFDQNIKCSLENQRKISVDGGASVDKVNAYGPDLTVTVSGLARGKSYIITIPAGTVEGIKENQKASQAVHPSTSAAS